MPFPLSSLSHSPDHQVDSTPQTTKSQYQPFSEHSDIPDLNFVEPLLSTCLRLSLSCKRPLRGKRPCLPLGRLPRSPAASTISPSLSTKLSRPCKPSVITLTTDREGLSLKITTRRIVFPRLGLEAIQHSAAHLHIDHHPLRPVTLNASILKNNSSHSDSNRHPSSSNCIFTTSPTSHIDRQPVYFKQELSLIARY